MGSNDVYIHGSGLTTPSAKSGNLAKRELRHVRDTLISIVIAIIVVVLLRQFVVGVYVIPSASMSPTIAAGDRIAVLMFVPEVKAVTRGDVVVFTDPGGWLPPTPATAPNPFLVFLRLTGIAPPDPGNLILKRVIGLPGDHITCCSSTAGLTLNNVPLKEPYLSTQGSSIPFDVVVPPEHLWVMGDNRDDSADSRLQKTKFVPIADVVGVAGLIVWPVPHFGSVRH